VHGNAPRRAAARTLDFSRVHACTNVQSECRNRVTDRERAANRARRPLAEREEPVACGVDLLASEARQLAPNRVVMAPEQLGPRAVAELARLIRRVDDVGEENRRKHTCRHRRRLRTRQELFDLVEDLVAVHVWHVIVARKLDKLCAGNPPGNVATLFDV